ncbi:MAG TPA: hypothetical protein VFA07_05125 [Chthonomonadaceae bacterium]|nr:hypothetical protein [Chthonomonadaceae bacterium]
MQDETRDHLQQEDADVALARDALRLSAHVLSRERTQLASQLLGRLPEHAGSRLEALYRQVERFAPRPCLLPRRPTLSPAGGPLLRILEGHSSTVYAVALTLDGKRAVSGSGDSTLKIWDLETGKPLQTLQGHSNWVSAVALSPDGKRAVSGSGDNTLKVWDLEKGAILAEFTADGNVYACATAPNGKTIVAGDSLGRVHFLSYLE